MVEERVVPAGGGHGPQVGHQGGQLLAGEEEAAAGVCRVEREEGRGGPGIEVVAKR